MDAMFCPRQTKKMPTISVPCRTLALCQATKLLTEKDMPSRYACPLESKYFTSRIYPDALNLFKMHNPQMADKLPFICHLENIKTLSCIAEKWIDPHIINNCVESLDWQTIFDWMINFDPFDDIERRNGQIWIPADILQTLLQRLPWNGNVNFYFKYPQLMRFPVLIHDKVKTLEIHHVNSEYPKEREGKAYFSIDRKQKDYEKIVDQFYNHYEYWQKYFRSVPLDELFKNQEEKAKVEKNICEACGMEKNIIKNEK